MTSTVQIAVLAILAKEWDAVGPPGIMDISDIVTAMPFSPGDTMAALKDLFVSGLIDMNQIKSSAFLTPEGYAQATTK